MHKLCRLCIVNGFYKHSVKIRIHCKTIQKLHSIYYTILSFTAINALRLFIVIKLNVIRLDFSFYAFKILNYVFGFKKTDM